MNTPKTEIEYEGQSDSDSNRTCGAACLSMVYRSFGKEVPQDQIWPAIAKQNQFGRVASTTHLMVADVISRGYGAVAIQVRRPLDSLRFCRESGIRAILNHRVQHESPAGHYSVLVDIDEQYVVLHDPLLGPSLRLTHAELLTRWQPLAGGSEILGNVLIAVAAAPIAAEACALCGAPMVSSVPCPKCGQIVSLQPAAILGCIDDGCAARMWNYLICPACDYTWSFSLQHPEAGASVPGEMQPTPSAEEDPWRLNQVFSRLDAFCNHVLSIPGAAEHPDVKRQIDFMKASKERLKQAQAEQLAYSKIHHERLTAMLSEARQRHEAHRKKMEELNTPAPPLDGSALAVALLKNMGFID